MPSEKKQEKKTRLHPRNRNRERYDLDALLQAKPELANHIITNKFGVTTVNFYNPLAVKLLNQALLSHYYGIPYWDFPNQNLCPPIPGRADYLHYIADLLAENNGERIPTGNKITCLDVGVGATCIYPILGVAEYNWQFIGVDVSSKSIASSQKIVAANASLNNKIEFRLQQNRKHIFNVVLTTDDVIDVTMCNPPFHASIQEAQKGTLRKIKNLSGKKIKTPELNFAGVSNELIYKGGEYAFIATMIKESKNYAKNCFWFTTLVSKQSNLHGIYNLLQQVAPSEVKTIPIGTGNKSARIVAWTFLTKKEKQDWQATKWK